METLNERMNHQSTDALLLLDGFNFLSRCYFATSYGRSEEQLSKNKDGHYINALPLVFNKLIKLIQDYQPTHVAVAWDIERNQTKRKQKYDFYKANRGNLPHPLIDQFETLKTTFQTIGISQITVDGYEADDVIGAMSHKWSKENGRCLIYSNDRDLLQLLNEQTSQILSIKQRGDQLYTLRDFEREYNIQPSQWIDVKSLLGDKGDNIPGVKGVGEKAALPLIQMYQNIDAIYENIEHLNDRFKRYKKRLIEGKEMAYISKELVEIPKMMTEIDSLDWNTMKIGKDKKVWQDECLRLGINVKL